LDAQGAGDGLEVLLLEGMDVQLVAAAGRDEKVEAKQLAVGVLGGLAVDDAVLQERVVYLISGLGQDLSPCVLLVVVLRRRGGKPIMPDVWFRLTPEGQSLP
jgi:hypothetical protein